MIDSEAIDSEALDETSETVAWTGLDPVSGAYLIPPLTWPEVYQRIARGLGLEPLESLEYQHELLNATATVEAMEQREPPHGVDPLDLASAGWGVVFAEHTDPSIRRALEPLLAHREYQAGPRFQIFDGDQGLRPGQTADQWLTQFGLGPGVGDVDCVPYYLLVVGDPRTLPFGVDFDLATGYAVGRIGFEDPEAHRRYANTVIEADHWPAAPDPRFTVFATEHPKDIATRSGMRNLVRPPVADLASNLPSPWQLEAILGDTPETLASKARLQEILSDPPQILYTAGHALGPDARGKYLDKVGGLVCSDYPGPKSDIPLNSDHYFTAADLPVDTDLRGTIAVLFGCYTAGMPELDQFAQTDEVRERLGPHAILSPLAEKMLSLEYGALAILGHIDRTKGHSYLWNHKKQPYTFQSVAKALADGHPIGHATRFLGKRYNDIARIFSGLQLEVAMGRPVDKKQFTSYWLARQDARSYLILGDPAVRIAQ